MHRNDSAPRVLPSFTPSPNGPDAIVRAAPGSRWYDRDGRTWTVDQYGENAWVEGVDAPSAARPLTFLQFAVGPLHAAGDLVGAL